MTASVQFRTVALVDTAVRRLVGVFIAVAVVASGLSTALSTPVAAVVPGLNGRIAFTSFRDGNNEIYSLLSADGLAAVRLTTNVDDVQPS